ncbi:helix-turn-helix domain-containing protein, partial [Parabacteroides sp. OttesenSCG-928-J18]|nr:helix-turn-helix domain-containing protein [Parabacteroides sp. OttesenSCG-928-J18]
MIKVTSSREQFEKEAVAYYYGVILRDKRKELKITQQSLAEKVGLKRSYIAKIEKGETDLQISSFVRIARALGM